MKYSCVLLLILLYITGCSDRPEYDLDELAPTTTPTTTGNVSTRSALAPFLNEKQITRILDYRTKFESATTATEVQDLYTNGSGISMLVGPTLNEHFTRIVNVEGDTTFSFQWLDTIVPGMCFMEYDGPAVSLFPKFSAFVELASTTPETSDDAYFGLLANLYQGDCTDLPSWFLKTWDYGGVSLLGSGIHYSLLLQIQEIISNEPEVAELVWGFHNMVISDINNAPAYQYDVKTIITEVEKIRNEIELSAEDKQQLQERIGLFKDPAGVIQLNCQKGDCVFGQ